MGGPRDALSAPLPRARRMLAGAIGFIVTGLAVGTLSLVGGDGAAGAAARPSASAVPTKVSVRALSVTRIPEQDGEVAIVLLNEGPPVRLVAARVEGPGYAPVEGGGFPGLAVRGTGSLYVAVRPDCSAGLGSPRRPSLALELVTLDGAASTVRQELTGSAGLPAELVGQCDAPLADGARVSVRLMPAQDEQEPRLQVTLTAGRGLLWVEQVTGDMGVLGSGPPIVVQPGSTEVIDLVLQIPSCEQSNVPPAAPAVWLRREPPLTPRVVSFAEVGGPAYAVAVAAAVERVCG